MQEAFSGREALRRTVPFGSSTSSMAVPSAAKPITTLRPTQNKWAREDTVRGNVFDGNLVVQACSFPRLFGVPSVPGTPVTTFPPRTVV